MNYTTIEQSKHLSELGLNPETADMWWSRCCIIDFNDGKGLSIGYSVQPVNLSKSKNTDKDIPCWSAEALIKAINKPLQITYFRKEADSYYQVIDINFYGAQEKSLIDALYKYFTEPITKWVR